MANTHPLFHLPLKEVIRMVKWRFLELGQRTAARPSYPAPFEKFN